VGEYRERLFDFANAQGIQIEFKESSAPALGMSYGGTIDLLPGQGTAEEFSTLVHELAHRAQTLGGTSFAKKRQPGHDVRVGDGTTKQGRLMRG